MNRPLIAVFFVILAVAGYGAWQLATGTDSETDTVSLTSGEQRVQPDAAEILAARPDEQPETTDSAPTRAAGESTAQIEVHGRVVDKDREPLPDAEIKLRPTKNTRGGFVFNQDPKDATKGERTAKTDASGHFRFVVDPSTSGIVRLGGKQWILTKAARFTSSPQDIDLGDLECVKTATLSGRVHSGGRGLADVKVNVYTHGSGYRNENTETAKDGTFTIEGLAPGTCTLMCSSPKHLTKQRSLALEPGQVESNIEVELAAGTSLSGQVVDDIGRPIADINISAHGHYEKTEDGTQFVQGRTKSDEHGFFTLNGLAGKTLNINANGEGYASYWKNKVPIDGGLLTIQLERLGSISGILLSENNEPIAGSTVRATRKGRGNGLPGLGFNMVMDGHAGLSFAPGGGGKTTKTDDKGRFVIENINRGTVNLIATGKHREAEYKDVVIVPGAKVEGITIRAERGVVAEVTVVDPDGEPVEGANVTAMVRRERRANRGNRGLQQLRDLELQVRFADVSGNGLPGNRYFTQRTGSATTDKDGKASVWGLEAGTYTFHAEHAKWVRGESQPLAVPSHGTVKVDLHTLRGGSVEITAFDASGAPLANVRVRVKAKVGKEIRNGTTDTTGRLTIGPLAPGGYEASLSRSGGYGGSFFDGAYLVSSLSDGSRSLASVPFEIHESQTTKVRLEKPLLTELSGVVRDSVGPIAQAVVQITEIDPQTQKGNPRNSHTAYTDQKGEYTIKDVDPGTYHIAYRRNWRAFPVLEQLVVTGGVKSQVANLMISGRSLTVVVRSKGAPIAKAQVQLRTAPSESSNGLDRACNATTNEQGEAVLGDLRPGDYVLTVTRQGYATHSKNVQLGSDRLEIDLVEAGKISVTAQGAMVSARSRFAVEYRLKGETNWASRSSRGTVCEVGNLAPGQYEVRAAMMTPGSNDRNWCNPVVVDVQPGKTAPVALPVR